jgi:predicted nucleotidyltransferase
VSLALRELKEGLEALYGERFRGLYLYGSYARGTAHKDSDVDVLVALKGEVDSYAESNKTSRLLSDICLRHDVLIASLPVGEGDLREEEGPLFVNVRREGVPV